MSPISLIQCENGLSYAAAMPFLGTIPAIVKSVMGLGQTLLGVSMSVVAVCSKNSLLRQRGWIHSKNGAGNFLAGLLEAIPVVGTVLLVTRWRWAQGDPPTLYKWIDYSGYEERLAAFNELDLPSNHPQSSAQTPPPASNELETPSLAPKAPPVSSPPPTELTATGLASASAINSLTPQVSLIDEAPSAMKAQFLSPETVFEAVARLFPPSSAEQSQYKDLFERMFPLCKCENKKSASDMLGIMGSVIDKVKENTTHNITKETPFVLRSLCSGSGGLEVIALLALAMGKIEGGKGKKRLEKREEGYKHIRLILVDFIYENEDSRKKIFDNVSTFCNTFMQSLYGEDYSFELLLDHGSVLTHFEGNQGRADLNMVMDPGEMSLESTLKTKAAMAPRSEVGPILSYLPLADTTRTTHFDGEKVGVNVGLLNR